MVFKLSIFRVITLNGTWDSGLDKKPRTISSTIPKFGCRVKKIIALLIPHVTHHKNQT